MKSTTNRYRPPRMQYRLDDWKKKTKDSRKKKGMKKDNKGFN